MMRVVRWLFRMPASRWRNPLTWPGRAVTFDVPYERRLVGKIAGMELWASDGEQKNMVRIQDRHGRTVARIINVGGA